MKRAFWFSFSLILAALFLAQSAGNVTGAQGTITIAQDIPPTPMACVGPIQEPGCPVKDEPQPPALPYGDVVATAVAGQPAAATPKPSAPVNRKGEVTASNWSFKAYLKNNQIEIWGLTSGYPKMEGETYMRYYSVSQPTTVVKENKVLKTWTNGLLLSQLSGTVDGLTITCQVNLKGDENPYKFICGTIQN